MYKIAVLSLVLVGLAGACAPKPEHVARAYYPEHIYSHMSCHAMRNERTKLLNYLNFVSARLAGQAASDTAAATAGVLLFPPFLLALSAGSDESAHVATAKGQYQALLEAGARKGCFPPDTGWKQYRGQFPPL